MSEVIRSKGQSEFSAQQARARMSFERVMVGLSSAGVTSGACALYLHDWLIAGAIIAATLLSLKLLLDRAVSAHHGGSPAPAAAASRRSGTAAGAGKRILILVENLPVPPDRRVWQQATTLVRAGHSVTVISPKRKGWSKSREVIDGVTILRHRLPEARSRLGYLLEYGIGLASQTLLAWRVFLISGIDVIQACNPPDLMFLIAAQFKPFGVRFMFDHHDLSPELFGLKFGQEGRGYRLMRALERATFRLADHVMCTNEAFRQLAIERGGKDVRDTSVVLSSPEMRPEMSVVADPTLKRGRRYAVLYVGVMGSQDGVDLLLDAAFELIHELGRHDVQFLLAGDGPERPALVRKATELRIAEHITFLGFVTGPRLWQAFRSADLGVCPDPKNRFNDHLTMNKLLEYMAFGLPLIAFNLSVSMQLVGDTGRFVEGNDPCELGREIGRLLDNPAARHDLGRRARQRFEENLSWQRQARRLLVAYDRINGTAHVERHEAPASREVEPVQRQARRLPVAYDRIDGAAHVERHEAPASRKVEPVQRQARRLPVAYDRIDGPARVERHEAPASREPETV